MEPTNAFVLGVDVGVRSVGLALIDPEGQRIVHTAVRVFPAGVEGDFEAGKDESNNKKRRQARLARRQTERRARRLRKIFHLLQRHGLLPEGEAAAVLKALDQQLAAKYPPYPGIPYTLRAKALDHALEPHELGRALYHLAQRRGFLSNRRAPVKDDEKPGEVAGGIEGLWAAMREAGARTLGEYFSKLNPHSERIRGRYTHRKMYEQEFDAIWNAQAMHHPGVLTEPFRAELHSAIFHQRPLKDQSHLIGTCSLIPAEKRAPLYELDVQHWRLLDRVNNLRVCDRNPERLTESERRRLVEALTAAESLTYAQVRKILGLPKESRFTIESGGEEKIPGNVTYARFANALNLKWDQLPRSEQDALVKLWASAPDDESFRAALERQGGFSQQEIQSLLEVRLPDGYASLSLVAIRRLLPYLEQGVPYGEARKLEFPESFAPTEPKGQLPPVLEALPELRNPVVTRTLTELRKAVNELLRRYGKPAEIHIELARDLKRNRSERQALAKRMRDNEKKREQAREALKQNGHPDPSREAVLKYLLAEECNWQCPYSGRTISWESLFDEPQFDIEHIIPYSRSLDDSFQNKTLCARDYNALKGNRTPWEAFHHTEEWEAMVERVKRFGDPGKLKRVKQFGNRAKLKRFTMEETDTAKLLEAFSSNELNDTRYMSKLAAKYLGLLYGGVTDAQGRRRVFACAGQITATLRRLWNLDQILSTRPEKTREDHRHHAVDAATVAMVTPGIVQALAQASARAEAGGQRRLKSFAEPWPGFREALQVQILERTVVSHRPERKLAGALHEETFYGRPHEENGKAVVHIRKFVHKLDRREIENIVDPTVRARVKLQLELVGGDPKRLEAEPPWLETRDGRRIPVRKVRVKQVAKTVAVGEGARQRHVITGDNHHMAVFAVQKRGKTSYEAEVVSRLEAVERHRRGQPVVQKDRGPDREFLFSLSAGDMVRWKDQIWRVRGVKQAGVVELSLASDARLKTEMAKNGGLQATTIASFCKSGLRKVHVSPLGEVREAHD